MINLNIPYFAAGVVFLVVAVEILPQVVDYHNGLLTTLGFGGAIVLVLLIRQLTEGAHQPDQSPPTAALPVTFLVLLDIDVVVDGLLLGVGFSAGAKEGKLLAYALGIESISLGLATAATFTLDFCFFCCWECSCRQPSECGPANRFMLSNSLFTVFRLHLYRLYSHCWTGTLKR